MLYAIFCYRSEDVVSGWSKAEDDAVMARLAQVEGVLRAEGRLGPVARLLPTTAATSLRHGRNGATVLDGPFVDTREQLLGFYVVDCISLAAAIEAASALLGCNGGPGGYEIRPIAEFRPGGP